MTTLYQALRERPQQFTFFETLRRVECAFPASPRLGHSTKPEQDPLRLGHTATLEFAPREIDRFDPPGENRPARLQGLFLGLFGPNAPMPLHLTEYAIDRQRNGNDSTLLAFADIFHHRMLSLFYRAWADAQPTVQLDRPDEDRFRTYVGSLVGMATPHLDGRDALPDRYKLFFAGRLLPQARNAEGLRSFIKHFFGVAVEVIEFVAEWMRLPEDAHLRMGVGMAGMGRTAVMGEYVRGAQQRFRLRLGPLSQAQFNRFLPGGEALEQLDAAIKTYLGDEMHWDVQMVLKKEDVPRVRLGQAGRMGLSTWMGNYRKNTDADEVVLNPGASHAPR